MFNLNAIVGNFSSYCHAINTAYFLSNSKYFFTGVDDLEMTDGWDIPVIDKLESNQNLSVIGSKVMPEEIFQSYLTIRRSYVRQHSLVSGISNLVFYPYYHHEADRELYWTAKNRQIFNECPESIIYHKQLFDETQKKTNNEDYNNIDHDTYWERRHLFRGA
jgi:hypothetical protein